MKCAPTRPSRQQQGATWTQDGLHVCHGATPIWDVFHHLSRHNNIKGILAEVRCKVLDIAHDIHARSRHDVHTYVLGRTAAPHNFTNRSIHVVSAHLKNPHAGKTDGFKFSPTICSRKAWRRACCPSLRLETVRDMNSTLAIATTPTEVKTRCP